MNKKLYLVLVVVLTLIFAVPAFAISNGEPDGNGHPHVGAFAVEAEGEKALVCSGTLISPTVFLTAGHCTFFLEPAGFSEVYVTFDSEFSQSSNFIASDEWYTHPKFGHDMGNLYDLAVIILPAGSTPGLTPATLPEEGLLSDLAAQGGLRGVSAVNVGYGTVPDWKQAPPRFNFDGVRRVSTSPDMGLTKSWFRLLMNNDATGEGGVCYGDSGGPHFLQTDNGEVLVATTTGGDAVCRALSYNYRLDIPGAREFLDDFVTLP
jgi:hypothetical protein